MPTTWTKPTPPQTPWTGEFARVDTARVDISRVADDYPKPVWTAPAKPQNAWTAVKTP